MDPNSDFESTLPLTEVTYFILLSLAPGPKHGYGMMKDVRFMSKGRVVLSTGTLYGALPRLVEQGWISRDGPALENRPGRQRKMYRLTPLGQQVLEAEINRLDSLVIAAQKRITREST